MSKDILKDKESQGISGAVSLLVEQGVDLSTVLKV